MRYFFLNIVIIFCFTLASGPVFGYVASSSSYRLEKDSLNFAGIRSSSTSYVMEDTVGEISTGTSTSASYNINAGYQAMESGGVSVAIVISSPANIAMSPSIEGGSGEESDGSITWTVITNNPNGYALSVKASTDPALKSTTDSFADYSPVGLVPDFTFTVGASESKFGFSPEGTDVVDNYKDNSSVCGVGASNTTNACWDGFGLVDKNIASSNAPNNPTGTATTLKLKAKTGSTATLSAGSYEADLITTAVAL